MPDLITALHTLPTPEAQAAAHSAQLLQLIRAEIAATPGAISFARFMELALYAPALGYYCAGSRKFGAGGDFITAPELSPLFSRCVARQCQEMLAALDGGMILELGAGSGRMAADLLAELQLLDALPTQYAILERSAELRARQRCTLQEQVPHLLERIVWLDTLPSCAWRGIVLANEVLDALPVERFTITAQGARRIMVTWTEAGLAYAQGAEDAEVSAAVAHIEADLGQRLPEGYTSEYVPHLQAWLAAVAEHLQAGALLFIDYGYPRRSYYHAQRSTGTLLCHYRHRAHDNALILVGLQDMTANVDFTAVAEAAIATGLDVAGYTKQNAFLFGCGLLELLETALAAALTTSYLEQARQVKLLTLPSEMGERFQVLALTRNLDYPWRGFSFHDERSRL